MKVSVRLHSRPDQLGRHKIYLRLYKNGKYKEKATNIRVTPEQFEDGRIVNHVHSDQLNKQLRILMLNAELKILKSDDVKYKDADFFKYTHDCIEKWGTEKKPETLRQLTSERRKVKGYNDSFKLSEIDEDWLKGYQTYCQSLGNTRNTVWKSFKFIRLIVLKAKKERLIEQNPFDFFDMPKYKEVKKVYLSKEEINQLDKAVNKMPEQMAFCANWFLIGCLTGLRLGDQRLFDKKKHIKDNRIVLYTSKTGEVVSLPISEKIKELLERVEYQQMKYTPTHYNRLLRSAVAVAGIDQHLSVHTSRHTFAVLCAASGISQEVTAKLMGHGNMKSTSVYYKINNPRIDEELRKISL